MLVIFGQALSLQQNTLVVKRYLSGSLGEEVKILSGDETCCNMPSLYVTLSYCVRAT